MAIQTEIPPGRERTRALLAEIAGGRRAVQLRGQVAAVKRGATREQIEEAFQEACLRAGRSCRGQSMGEVYKWLLKTTDSLVDDARDRLKREVLVDHSARAFQLADPALAPPDEVLIKREERAELNQLTLEILERLDERARQVAVLHCHGMGRQDIARQLGISARIVKRDVEGILATGREQLGRMVGTGCPDGHRLVSRYAFGLAGGREAQRAQLHLATCARCGAMFERLDGWRERVAALVPLAPAAAAHEQIAERALQAGTHGAIGLRQHAGHAVAHLRERSAGMYYRSIDPTPLAGARPGAVVAAVAGCLAIGGGAGYCVHQRTDPIAAVAGLARPAAQHHRKPARHQERARAAATATPTATTVASTPTAVPTATPTSTQAPSSPPSATPVATATPRPAPQEQFEPTSAGASRPVPAHTSAVGPDRPAPAPAGGPGEFGGP